MRVEDKKTASSVKPKAETSKVTNNVNTAILPADPLDGAAVGVDWFGLPTPSGRFVRQQ